MCICVAQISLSGYVIEGEKRVSDESVEYQDHFFFFIQNPSYYYFIQLRIVHEYLLRINFVLIMFPIEIKLSIQKNVFSRSLLSAVYVPCQYKWGEKVLFFSQVRLDQETRLPRHIDVKQKIPLSKKPNQTTIKSGSIKNGCA